MKNWFVLPLLLLIGACQPGEPEIPYGEVSCGHCAMHVMDPQFGAMTVNEHGKPTYFDSIECMITAMQQGKHQNSKYYVAHYTVEGPLQNAEDCAYHVAESVRSPMGGHVGALPVDGDMPSDGIILTWSEVQLHEFMKH